MTIFQDKLLTRTDCDEAGDYVVPNVLSPRDLVFRPAIGPKTVRPPEGSGELTLRQTTELVSDNWWKFWYELSFFFYVKTKARIRCATDQGLCFHYIYSTIPLLPKCKIPSHYLSSVTVQLWLSRTWSQTPKTSFHMTQLISKPDMSHGANCFWYICISIWRGSKWDFTTLLQIIM